MATSQISSFTGHGAARSFNLHPRNLSSSQSDYNRNKRATIEYCHIPRQCGRILRARNYGEYNAVKGRINELTGLKADRSKIISASYLKENLNNVCTVGNGYPCAGGLIPCGSCGNVAAVNPGAMYPFFWTNTIDPVGELYGNYPCGVLNYVRYMECGN